MMSMMSRMRTNLRRHIWSLVGMLTILLILTIPELENAWIHDPCALQEADQGVLTTYFYGHLSNWAFHFHSNPGPPVTIVYIDPTTEPAELLTNTCLARVFLAQLVQDIANLHAKAIVIDKFYSDSSCTDIKKNDIFKTALNSNALQIPIVVGQPTHLLANVGKANGGCLALSKQFDFGAPQVKYGLTRLNSDLLKIPLRWPIFTEGDDPTATPKLIDEKDGLGDSLAVVAARLIDPSLLTSNPFKKLNKHPYTSFLDLPSLKAMTVRCNAEQNPLDADGHELDCTKVRQPPNELHPEKLDLAGKVVVIGDLSDQDTYPFPDDKKEEAGVYLQANYIKSILDRRFLREIPFFVTLVGLILFIISVYCLHWFLRPGHAFLVSSIALLTIAFISFITLMKFNYYTPLWALSSAAVLVVLRYLETKAHHYSTQMTEENSHRVD
jgi:CHASE2 domain-containing protein